MVRSPHPLDGPDPVDGPPTDDRPTRPTLLSIVGPGRSGTTILARILGGAEGVESVGELRWLWRRGVLEHRPCGCGLPLDECPVWSKVLARTLDGRVDAAAEVAAEVVAAQGRLGQRRNRLRVVRRAAAGTGGWPALDRVREVTADLVEAVTEVTGARVVVDSSKRAVDAAVLAGIDGVDQYVLHVVRDPGAVAFSWQRGDRQVRTGGDTRPMGTRGLLSSIARWTENSLSAEVLRRHVPAERWMFLRYEDFVADPRGAVTRVLAFTGTDAEPPFVTEDTVLLDTDHTVAGNPNRFDVGRVRVRLDDEWTRRMPRHRQLAVRLLTGPLLLRYGYGIRRRRPSAAPA